MLYSNKPKLAPYEVIVSDVKTDRTIRTFDSVPHSSGDKPMVIKALLPFEKQLTIYVKSIGKPEFGAFINYTRPAADTAIDAPASKPQESQKPQNFDKGKTHIVHPKFGMNCTGYGYRPGDVDSLPGEWRERVQFFKDIDGIDDLRPNIMWQDWNPSDGVYTEIEMRRLLKYCERNEIGFAFCMMPYRTDNMIRQSEKAVDHAGRAFDFGNQYHTFAPGALVAQAAFYKANEHFAEFLAKFCPDAVFASLGWGETEEFYLPLYKNHNDGTNEVSGMCMFSPADKELFRTQYGREMPVYHAASFPESAGMTSG